MNAIHHHPARARLTVHHGGRAIWIVGEGAAGAAGTKVVSEATRPVADPFWCAGAEVLADHLEGAAAPALKMP